MCWHDMTMRDRREKSDQTCVLILAIVEKIVTCSELCHGSLSLFLSLSLYLRDCLSICLSLCLSVSCEYECEYVVAICVDV